MCSELWREFASCADIGPATSQELAEKTNLNERQLREWLSAHAASGYVTYDAARGAFFLTAEQAAVFADPNSPAAMTGGFYAVSAVYHDEPLVAKSFRTGGGLPWGNHHNCLFLRHGEVSKLFSPKSSGIFRRSREFRCLSRHCSQISKLRDLYNYL
jgi:winged helix-turn-helix protein